MKKILPFIGLCIIPHINVLTVDWPTVLTHLQTTNFNDINDMLTEEGNSLLKEAIYEDNIDIVQLLLSHGADVNAVDKYGEAPLIYAIYKKNIDILRLLLKYNAHVNVGKTENSIPLLQAVKELDISIAINITHLLLEHGANANVQDKNGGSSPLSLAIFTFGFGYHKNLDLVRLLLAYGADINLKDRDGKTPLDCAIDFASRSNKKDILVLLTDNKSWFFKLKVQCSLLKRNFINSLEQLKPDFGISRRIFR